MIPYIEQPSLPIGPVSIHGFGVLVAVCILVGSWVLSRRAMQLGITREESSRFVTWILVGGFIGAHLIDRFVYFPKQTMKDPLSILRVWSGISSFGGFLGGTLGALWFFRWHAKPGTSWSYAESFAYAFPFAWVFGRLGCAVAYDHPGARTQFFLGQVYEDHLVRHNLGLEEAIYTAFIAGVFLALGRRPRFVGFFLGLLLILYAPFRFAVDYLRMIDVRYLGLTPGQYGCVALVLAGIAILAHRRSHTMEPAPAANRRR
jgi:phosphatidylglycerol:prolipoprotein diacylglycerol transferase